MYGCRTSQKPTATAKTGCKPLKRGNHVLVWLPTYCTAMQCIALKCVVLCPGALSGYYGSGSLFVLLPPQHTSPRAAGLWPAAAALLVAGLELYHPFASRGLGLASGYAQHLGMDLSAHWGTSVMLYSTATKKSAADPTHASNTTCSGGILTPCPCLL